MRNFIFLFSFGALFIGASAQTQQPTSWQLTGNTGNLTSNYLGTTDCSSLIFKTGGQQRMCLLPDKSFLGIGASTPHAPLHLHYQVDPSQCSSNNDGSSFSFGKKLLLFTTDDTGYGSNNGFAICLNSTKDVTLYQQEQANIFFEGLGGGLMIAPDGNVGVGNYTPHAKLDVAGSFLAQSANIEGLLSTNKFNINHTASGNWEYAFQLKVNNDYTKAFAIKNTLTNTDIFLVYGNGVMSTKKIFTEKIEITSGALGYYWYDHVFYPEYKLRSLDELEKFINQNKHLPEIPSAREIEKNGLDLGDMQGKLLMKIEELTLYIIDLQKQINELKQTKGGE